MPSLFYQHGGRNYGLASQRLNTGRGQTQLGTPLLSMGAISGMGSAARGLSGAIRAPQLRSSDTRFTPLPTPDFVPSTLAKDVAKFANTWANAAFDFQNRENKILADRAVNQYELAAQKIMYGGVDEATGEGVVGYTGSEGLEAKGGYNIAVEGLTAKRDEILEGLDPAVRQKALLRMENIYNNAIGKAATHRAKQMKVAEKQTLLEEGQIIASMFEIGSERENAWTKTLEHANKFKDPAQKMKVLGDMMELAVDKIIDEAQQEGKTPMQAWKEANDFFQTHREDVPETVETAISSKLRQDGQKLEEAQKKLVVQANTKTRDHFNEYGGQQLSRVMSGGVEAMKQIPNYVKQVQSVSKSPAQMNKILTKNYKDAFKQILTFEGYDSVKISYNNFLDAVQEAGAQGQYMADSDIIADLNEYVHSTLRRLDESINKDKKIDWENNQIESISVMDLPEVQAGLQALRKPNSFTPEEEKFVRGQLQTKEKELLGKEDDEKEKIRNDNYLKFKALQDNDLLTRDHIDEINALRNKGLFAEKPRMKIIENWNDKKSGGSSSAYITSKNLGTRFNGVIDTQTWFYDPETGTVGRWADVSGKEQRRIENNIENNPNVGDNREADQKRRIVAAITKMYEEEWKPKNPNKTAADFYNEFMDQRKGDTSGVWSLILGGYDPAFTRSQPTYTDEAQYFSIPSETLHPSLRESR